MNTIILCGGKGTRLSEETDVRPKPMIEVGDRPILWHIMNHYASFGFKDFYLALGYKQEYINFNLLLPILLVSNILKMSKSK